MTLRLWYNARMTKSEAAKAYFLSGYNCAQAVALAFREETGLDEETLSRATVALGGGLGRLRETCGAVSGGAVVLGLVFPEKSKSEIYALVQKLALAFREENGSYNCGQLLSGVNVTAGPSAEPRTESYYKKRPCADLVASSAAILEELIATLQHGT